MDDEALLRPWLRRGFSRETARELIARLRAGRLKLAEGAHGLGRGSTAERANKKRFARRVTRDRRRIMLRAGIKPIPLEAFQERATPEPILDGLYPDRHRSWLNIAERRLSADAIELRTFSFLDAPRETLTALRRMAELEATIAEGRLDFLDQPCRDIGPYLVLAEMERGMLPVFRGGRITHHVKKVLHSVGLRRSLRMNFPINRDDPAIVALPFRSRRPQDRTEARLLSEQTSEQAAADVVDAINTWASEIGYSLSENGEALVLKVMGETLNNAERHSDPSTNEGSWSLAGFMARTPQAEGRYVWWCHLALMSTGATIAGSMRETADPRTKAKMARYVAQHRTLFSRGVTEENLETVFALQDGVSRMKEALGQGRGGTGLMDILEFFAGLSQSSRPDRSPKLCIVSGATWIGITGPYMQGTRFGRARAGLLAPRQLWFNPANSPDQPPDPAHVVSLPAPIKGTIVTMRWTLDRAHLSGRDEQD